MKKLILGLLYLGILASCQIQSKKEDIQNSSATLKVTLKNFSEKEHVMYYPKKERSSDAMKKVGVNAFELTVDMAYGEFATIFLKPIACQVFLTPGSTLNIEIDSLKVSDYTSYNGFWKGTKITGDNVKENTYLNKINDGWKLQEYSLSKLIKEDKVKDGGKYKELLTNYYQELQDGFKKANAEQNFHDDFVYYQKATLESAYVAALDFFDGRISHFLKDKAIMPEDYYDYRNDFDYCNDKLYARSMSYAEHISITATYNFTDDEAMFDNIDNLLYKDSYRNRIYLQLTYRFAQMSKNDATDFYNKIKSRVTDEKTLQEIDEAYETALKSGEGAELPNFAYRDRNGNIVQLSDFRGKYVYIDFWATWCGPCKAQIPYLKKLEEKYKNRNIVFVTISQDRNLKTWKKYLDDHHMHGVQLNSGTDKELSNFLGINGIPRFTFVDREGKLIVADAPRPQEIEQISKLFDSQEDL